MTTFSFIANLQKRSVEAFDEAGFKPRGWLLSSHRLNASRQALAIDQVSRGAMLFADNGTKDLIDDVIKNFHPSTEGLRADILALRKSLPDGRDIPHKREVPDALRQQARQAAHEVLDFVDALLGEQSPEALLDAQLSIQPTHLIAQEDFAVASLTALGLEREITRWPVSYYTRRNRKTVKMWQRVAADPRSRRTRVYATLGAVDYSTARAAGRLAADNNITRVALGFVGINLDRIYVQSFDMGHGRKHLSSSAPRRYVRLAEICCGIRDGFRERGVRLRAFHALGLGAAVQFPILARTFDWYTHISTDSTSPIHDSSKSRVFYHPGRNGDRVSNVAATRELLAGRPWPFRCAFCRNIRRDYGHDDSAAKDWWDAQGQPKITRAHLDPEGPLGGLLPLFASGRGPKAAIARRARTGHNHWALDRLALDIPSSRRSRWGDETLLEISHGEHHRSVRWGVAAAREVAAYFDRD